MQSVREWTVLVYMNANNNLANYDALRFARETRWPKLIQKVVSTPA